MPALSGEKTVPDLPQLRAPNVEARGQDPKREGLLLCRSPHRRLLPPMFETDLQRSAGPPAGRTRGGINGKHRMGNAACRLDLVVYHRDVTDLLHDSVAAASFRQEPGQTWLITFPLGIYFALFPFSSAPVLSFSEIRFFSPVNPFWVGERDVKSHQIETS